MFSDIKIWPNKNTTSKIRANGSVLVHNMMRVKFTVVQGSKGLFVSLPSKSYKDKEGNTKWTNEVYIEDEKALKTLNTQVLASFQEQNNNNVNQAPQQDDIPW